MYTKSYINIVISKYIFIINLIYFFSIIYIYTAPHTSSITHKYLHMYRSKSLPSNMNTVRTTYAYSPLRQRLTCKQRKTTPHPYTLEFANYILTEIYQHIMKVVTNHTRRTMLLIRFPLLHGCIRPGFRCHRSEMEDFIEYIRAYAIRSYCHSVTCSFQKTKIFKQKIQHFSQVKMRNIIYAMSNTHYDCLGAFKIMCGHTVIWRNTMYTMCKPTSAPNIEDYLGKVYLKIDLIHYTVFPSNKQEICSEMLTLKTSIEDDNNLRYSFKIMNDLVC